MAALNGGLNLGSKLDIIYSGTVSATKAVNSTQGVAEFNHNLGYQPLFLAYWSVPANNDRIYYPTPYLLSETTGASAGLTILKVDCVADVDTINVYIVTPNTGSPNSGYGLTRTYQFYLYILKGSATGES